MKKIVTLNSKVTVRCNNVIQTYQLVESKDLDSRTTKISNMSPLGKLLLKSKVQDVIKIKTPSSTVKYKILAIK